MKPTSNKSHFSYALKYKKTQQILSSLTKFLIIFSILKLITDVELKQKEKKATKDSLKFLVNKGYPDELDEIFKTLDKQTKDCFGEIVQIFRKDFNNDHSNPYSNKNMALSDKYFEKINSQIIKKINKINFYENKNYTGVRWMEFKSSNNTEIKRMMDNHLELLSNFIQKNYSKITKSDIKTKKVKNNVIFMNLPEIIVDSYQYFYSKINELKKYFSKFYLFKGINKFNTCIANKMKLNIKEFFADNLKLGKITIKSLLLILQDTYSFTYNIIKSNNMINFTKNLKSLIKSVKIIPGM